MNHDLSFSSSGNDIGVADRRSPAWGAIFAGAVAALGAHILLMMLLTAIGMGAANPATDDNPVATFSLGTALAWTISALLSLYLGGWVAGRCAARVHSVSGTMHGFLVWCVGTIAAALLVTSGAGAMIGGAVRVASEGIGAMGKPLAGAADLAKQAVEQSGTALNGMIDEVSENPQVRNSGNSMAAARREIGQALRQLFRNGGNLRDPAARDATVQALTRSGVSAEDANRMVDGWISSMEQLRKQFDEAKAAAATKAREAADAASQAIAKGALWSFIGFVLGALAASFGGRRGQRWEYQHTEIGADTTLDPAARGAVPSLRVPHQA